MNGFEIIKTHKVAIMKKFGVKKIGVIGRSNVKDKGDLDVLVELDDGHKNFDNYISLKTFLEDLLERDIRLVPSKPLKFYFKKSVFEEVFYI